MSHRTSLRAPDEDEVTITVLGRGFGESMVLHLGNNTWVIVDSFRDSQTKNPAAMDYLQALDIDDNLVKAIVITHYDADHYHGALDLAIRYENARLCTTSVTDSDLFVRIGDRDRRDTLARELVAAIQLKKEKQLYRRLGPAQSPWFFDDGQLTAISPADAAVTQSEAELRQVLVSGDEAALKHALKSKNLCSVALYGSISQARFLLCGDVLDDQKFGWHAVLTDDIRQLDKVDYVKVAHHGSRTGYSEEMWEALVDQKSAHLVVAPFTGGRHSIPGVDDIRRLCNLGVSVHQVASSEKSDSLTLGNLNIRENRITGMITARRKKDSGAWTIDQPDPPAWRHDCDSPGLQRP